MFLQNEDRKGKCERRQTVTFRSRRKARARKKVKSLWPLTGINVRQPVGAAFPVGRRRFFLPVQIRSGDYMNLRLPGEATH